MLGRVAPAEDAVQETFLQWQKQDITAIQSPKAWLSKVVSRLCLDEIKSARRRKEQYVGPDLPEPLFAERSKSPQEALELAESLSMALLVVLDKLNPVQRAVFLLREIYDYDYAAISAIVERSEENCRKIAQRARDLVRKTRPKFERVSAGQAHLVNQFVNAVTSRDMRKIESMLAKDAVMYSDGGGKVSASRKPIPGSEKIAKFLVGIQKGAVQSYRIDFREINGEPGMIFWVEDRVFNVWSFHIEEGKIKSIYVVLNPDKLRHLEEAKYGR